MATKILIVEDEEAIRKAYAQVFANAGCTVIESEEGMNGIVQAVEQKPDIILLDLLMPQVDGYELIKALRNNSSLDIPIIVLTNLSEPENRMKALEAGASEYLLKAEYPPEKLLHFVQTFLAQKKKGKGKI